MFRKILNWCRERSVKVIYHNAEEIDRPDDPTYPWLLVAEFHPIQYMKLAFNYKHGPFVVLKVRAKTKRAMQRFMKKYQIDTHPRLHKYAVTRNGSRMRTFTE